MNSSDYDILKLLLENKSASQRELSEMSKRSLGAVNKSIKALKENSYIGADNEILSKTYLELSSAKPKNAIILAAGFGLGMIPLNLQTPKALLEVNGEPLIERLIKQLMEAGIFEIYVVVGYMKEEFEYLIDKFNINLITNKDYLIKNNLHSLSKALPYISNSYIVPCDVWCEENPFSKNELYSWYMMGQSESSESDVKVNRNREIVKTQSDKSGNKMIGIAYILSNDAKTLCSNIARLSKMSRHNNDFWEEGLYSLNKFYVPARLVDADKFVDVNSFEDLRSIDESSSHLKDKVFEIIQKALNCSFSDIKNVRTIKKGMTNRSFMFECSGERYIMRIPGEGTDKLISRKQEADSYKALIGKDISDEIIYIDPLSGYKITKFVDNARVCDQNNEDDLKLCMEKLRDLHKMKIKVNHEFDIYERLEYYENLWGGRKSMYKDYAQTKEKILSLKPILDKLECEKVLSHIDSIPDNFLIYDDNKAKLIDWEYSGMHDPHVDIAMFCIYALYNKKEIDRLIDIYFENTCSTKNRIKIYCYIANCGLLWSNWCEYKHSLGIEFGEYSLKQYRYAKEYYEIAKKLYTEMENAQD